MKFIAAIFVVLPFVVIQGVCSAYDLTAPGIVDFGFTPTSLDTSSSAQPITFTALLQDDLSGVDNLSITFRSPSGRQSFGTYFYDSKLVSGTQLEGVYQGTEYLPRYSESGVWVIDQVSLSDRVNNWVDYYGDEAISFMSSKGLPFQFTVTGISDTYSPELLSFSFGPSSLDTSSSAQPITFTALLQDDLSGVDNLSITFRSPSGRQSFGTYFYDSKLVSGTQLEGVYQGTEYLPRYSESGVWVIDQVSLSDRVDNWVDYYGDEAISFMSSKGLPSQFTVTNSAGGTLFVFVGIQHVRPNNMLFTWMTEIGSRYRLEKSYSLEPDAWGVASDNILAHDSTHSVTIQATPGSSSAFFRVIKVVPK